MFKMGLGFRVTATLLGAAMLPLAVTTAVLGTVSLQPLRDSAREYRHAVVEDAANAVYTHFEGAFSELATAGAALAREDLSLDERLSATESVLRGARWLQRVGVYDGTGTLVDTFRRGNQSELDPLPERLSAAVCTRAARENIAVEAATRGPHGEPRYAMVAPILRGTEQKLYGFVRTEIPLTPLALQLAATSRRRFEEDPNRIYVVDAHLRVVVHHDEAMRGTSVAGRGLVATFASDDAGTAQRAVTYSSEYDVDGESMLGVLMTLPRLGWAVVVEQPRAIAYRAAHDTWLTILSVGTGFCLVTLIMGWILGRNLAGPVVRLSGAAQQVANGLFHVRVAVDRRDEIGQLGTAFNTMAAGLGDYRDKVVEETRIRTNLSRYLSPDIVERLICDESATKLGGTRQEVTVLFADVVGFTSLAETHAPEEVVGALNELFTLLTDIVFRHGGIVDKFLGDCVMAVFGAPREQKDHALRAVRAADDMVRSVDRANAGWQRTLPGRIELSIGINTGVVVAGNIGSERRMEYTVIGDAVNVAARLEPLARPGQVLLSGSTKQQVQGEFNCTLIGSRQLSGRRKPVDVYAVT